MAKKFDGSKKKDGPGRPPTPKVVEDLIVKFAKENRSWGYDRIVGALANVGHEVSHQTVANILKRHDLPPAPERKKGTTWKEFIGAHMAVMVATDFLSVEVLTWKGLVTYYILFFMKLGSRAVHVAGITEHLDERWMCQVARNLTMAGWGFLNDVRYLIHDRDSKYCAAFGSIIEGAGIEPLALPAHSPNLNAFAERWVRSAKEECTSKLIFFGEASLRHAVAEYVEHFLRERNHQGMGNKLLDARAEDGVGGAIGRIGCRKRLGGLLKFYHRIVG